MPDILTREQKEAIELLAQGGFKIMDVEYTAEDKFMHGTFLHLNGDCTLINIVVNDKGKVVIGQ